MNDNSPEKNNIPATSASSDQAAAATKAIELWARHSAGDPLALHEVQWLQNHWQAFPSTRQRIADEQWVNCLLRLQAETPAATEAFVQQVLQRCPPTTPPVDLSQNTTAKKTSPSLRWGWLIAAGLLLGLTATGIWYQGYLSSRRPNQANSPSLPPTSGDLAQTSPTPTQPVAPNTPNTADTVDTGLPTLDPSITAQLEPLTPPLDPDTMRVERPTPLEQDPPATDPLGTDTSGPLLATISRVAQSSGMLDESTSDPGTIQQPATWHEGQGLGATVLQLHSGELQLTMASGAVVEVYAPSRIELVGENALHLWQGEIAAQVPTEAIGFQVLTPTAMVTDLGTTFDVLVDPAGVTEIEVRGGQVSVATREQATQQQWLLTADDTYNLTLYSPTQLINPNTPVLAEDPRNTTPAPSPATSPVPAPAALAARLRHVSGRLTGVVSLDGRSLQFDDETVFATVRDRLFHGLEAAEDSLSDTWSQFVDARTAGPQPQGQLRLNDQEFNFGNFNEAIKAQNEILSQFAPNKPPRPPQPGPKERLGPPPGLDNFRGSLMIHGKRRDFNSWAEYREAMKELLGPLAEFGAFPFQP